MEVTGNVLLKQPGRKQSRTWIMVGMAKKWFALAVLTIVGTSNEAMMTVPGVMAFLSMEERCGNLHWLRMTRR
jgi:hypothetical protein